MLLRVFAVTDTSELGLACLQWCKFLLALDEPMRIASAAGAAEIMADRRGHSSNPWAELRDYFATPLEDEYVNIIIVPPNWERFWSARTRRNVAIVPEGHEPFVSTRFFNTVVFAGDAHERRGSSLHEVTLLSMAPLAANLETFRSVVLP